MIAHAMVFVVMDALLWVLLVLFSATSGGVKGSPSSLYKSIHHGIVPKCTPVEEGGTFNLIEETPLDPRLRDILWTVTMHGEEKEKEISHCYHDKSFCYDFTKEFTPSRKPVGQASYQNTMELKPVTAEHRGMILHIQNFDRNTGETSPAYSCLMDVYALPHKPVCRVGWLGENQATVTCETYKSYPDAVCQFFQVNEDTHHAGDVSGGKDVRYEKRDWKEDDNDYKATTCSLEVSLPSNGRFNFYALMKPRGAPGWTDAFAVRSPNTNVIRVDGGFAKEEELVDNCEDLNEDSDMNRSKGKSGRMSRHVSNRKSAKSRKHPKMKVGKSFVKHEERVSRVGESGNLKMSCEIETADVDSGFMDIGAVCKQDGRVVANQTSTSHKVVFVLNGARGMGDVRCECKSRFQGRCGMRHFGWFKIQVDDLNGNNEEITKSTLHEILLMVLLSVMAIGVLVAVCLFYKIFDCRHQTQKPPIYDTIPDGSNIVASKNASQTA